MYNFILILLIFSVVLRGDLLCAGLKEEILREYLKSATVLYNDCKYSQAIDLLLTKALMLDLNCKEAWYLLGRCYYKEGRISEFISSWSKAGVALERLKKYTKRYEKKYKYLKKLGGVFSKPIDIAIDKEDNIYVLDLAYDAVFKIDKNGELLKRIFNIGLQRPYSMIIEGRYAYISDFKADNIKKLDVLSGSLVGVIKKQGLKGPKDSVLYKNRLYVVYEGNIIAFDRKGKFILQFPKKLLKKPRLIDVDKKYILVWDAGVNALCYFTTTGNLIKKIKLPRIEITEMKKHPLSGDLYLISATGSIYVLSERYELKKVLRLYSHSPRGNFFSLSFDRIGLLYVTDLQRGIIHIIKPPLPFIEVFIDRIITEHFPFISLHVSIHSNYEKILGFGEPNILLVEDNTRPYPIGIKNLYKSRERRFVVLVEDSKELGKNFYYLKRLLEGFLMGLSEKDKVALFKYDAKRVRKLQDFTSITLAIKHVIYNSIRFEEVGRSFDLGVVKAIKKAIEELNPIFGKKYIILLTSSKGRRLNIPQFYLEELKYQLLNNNISLYVIDFCKGFKNESFLGFSKYFNFTQIRDLHKYLIAENIEKSQYIIEYYSPSRKWSQEEVKINLKAGILNFYSYDSLNYIIP